MPLKWTLGGVCLPFFSFSLSLASRVELSCSSGKQVHIGNINYFIYNSNESIIDRTYELYYQSELSLTI